MRDIDRLDSPILLLCSERSGSNLIGRIFDAHPEVAGPGAAHVMRLMARLAPRDLDPVETALRVFKAKLSIWRIDARGDDGLRALLQGAGWLEAPARLYGAEARERGKRRVLLKENELSDYLAFVMAASTAPRLLHMARDPRDMAASWEKVAPMRGGVMRAARQWRSDQRGALQALAGAGRGMPQAAARYEDLIADPEAVLARLCAGLRLPFDREMLRFFERDETRRDAAVTDAWTNLAKPVLSDNSGKFREALDDAQIAYVEAVCGDLMALYGYASARDGRDPHAGFGGFEALEAHMREREPVDKPAYAALPADQRAAFEAWSATLRALEGAPLRAPVAAGEGART